MILKTLKTHPIDSYYHVLRASPIGACDELAVLGTFVFPDSSTRVGLSSNLKLSHILLLRHK